MLFRSVIDAVRAALEPKGVVRPLAGTVASAVSSGQLPAESAGDSRNYTVQSEFVPAAEIQTEQEGRWKILGVIGQLYVLAESPEGLVLLDQHAAHERVLFEKMLKELAGEAAPSQKLLLPVTLEFDARDAEFLRSNLKTLHKLGIGIKIGRAHV